MLSFRPELGSPGKYIYPLGYMLHAYEEWSLQVLNSHHAIYISHLRTKVVNPMQKENSKMAQKGCRTSRICTSYFMGWLIFMDCMKCTLSHMYCSILGHFHLTISHPQTSLSWNTHTNKQIIWGSFRGRLGWFFFRDSVVILSKCLLFSNTVEYGIYYVQLILKGLGHEMNIFLKPIILNTFCICIGGF
jgi:hypothetical protein